MTDHEKRIREALEAGPTEGPFEVVRDGSYCHDIQTTDGYIVATTHGYVGDQVNSRPTAAYIAACNPAAIRALLADLDAVRGALKFYADGNHFVRADADAWETVSGEPPNFWEDEANTATVEDGTVARAALKGAEA